MTEPEQSPLAFFEGFTWAVPQAFAAPLAACRFEQGDVVYQDRASYTSAAEACRGHAIQVLSPPRSARVSAAEGESRSRRVVNWSSEVELAVVTLATGESRMITTTQGHLWSLLWKGSDEAGWFDASQQDAEVVLEPAMPLEARDLQAQLSAASEAFAEGEGRPVKKSRKKKAGSRFWLVVDLASDASLAKASLVESALGQLGHCTTEDLRPAEVGLSEADAFSPTLVMRQFSIEGRSLEAAEKALRDCLYQRGAAGAPASTESGEADTGAGRFSITRHGLLEALA